LIELNLDLPVLSFNPHLMRTSSFLHFLLVVCLLAFTSCRLDGETLVEGQIVDEHTGKPVGDGYVVVFGASSGGYSSSYGYVAEGKTDSKGRFGFTFEGSGDMVLRGFTEQGYYSDWQEGAVDLKSGRNNKGLKVEMMAPAWVKVKLVNVQPQDTSPYIYVWGFTPQNGQMGYGFTYINTDTSFVKMISANENRTISWGIRAQDGTDTEYHKGVIAPSLDTTVLRLEY
jgi:hypothetical protein